MKLAKLLFWCGVAYVILLVLFRGILPSEFTPTVSLVGIPLIVIAFIIARDLARRSTSPKSAPTIHLPVGPKEDPVKFMSGQIRIANSASDSYFENVVRARLKELLITKVAVETGMEREVIRRALSDPKESQKLLHSEDLYAVLYGPLPETPDRMSMIEDAVDMIGAWKG
jgi:hypothetical protein